MASEPPIRVGLIGVGRHGARYRDHLRAGDVPGLALAGIQRRDHARGQAEAAELEVDYHRTAASLAASVDALVVASPPGAHAEGVRAALAAGIPALVEKPLAPDVAAAEALAQEIGDAPIMVAHTLRYDVFFTALAVVSRDVGGAEQVDIACGRQGLGLREGEPQTQHPGLLDIGVHYLDWASLVAPGGFAWAYATERAPGETFAALGGVETELRLLIHSGPAAPLLDVRVLGPEGVLVGDGRRHRLALRLGDAEQELTLPPRGHALIPTLEAFAELAQGGSNPVPVAQALVALRRAEACLTSLRTGARVPLDESDP